MLNTKTKLKTSTTNWLLPSKSNNTKNPQTLLLPGNTTPVVKIHEQLRFFKHKSRKVRAVSRFAPACVRLQAPTHPQTPSKARKCIWGRALRCMASLGEVSAGDIFGHTTSVDFFQSAATG